jgi:hypothetical protein
MALMEHLSYMGESVAPLTRQFLGKDTVMAAAALYRGLSLI